jgi:branched-chain amino acid transport system substrate-binding protein
MGPVARSTVVLLMAVPALSASAQQAKPAGEPIVIAGTFDLSGAAADVGKDVYDGTQYAVDNLNKHGGVLGRPVELRYQDNGTNPAKSVEQANALIRDGAKFLMAPQSSASALAVSKTVSAKLKMPTCVSSSNSDDITIKEFEPYVFEVGPNSYMEMRAVATRLAKEPFKRYAIVSADYAGGRANANRFKEFIKAMNPQAEIVVEEYPKFGATDYTASINKIVAANPDYVYTVLFGSDLLTFSKQAGALGFFGQVKNNFMALYDGNTLKGLGENAAVGTEGWQRAPVNLLAKLSPEGKEYVPGFKEKLGHNPSDWTTLGYDCVNVWAQAAEAAKSVEPDAVMAAIETKEFRSVRGTLRFGKYDHQADAPVFIGKVMQSKEFGQPLLDVTDTIPGASVRPSEETVKALRAGN